jgi:hypothetical protein
VRHLRTQVSNKEVFQDVSPIGTCLIVGCSRAIGQEDEARSCATTMFTWSRTPSVTSTRTVPTPPCTHVRRHGGRLLTTSEVLAVRSNPPRDPHLELGYHREAPAERIRGCG